MRRPAWHQRRAVLAAAACLALAGPAPGWASAASARPHRPAAPPVQQDTTPLPTAVVDAGSSSAKTTTTAAPSAGSGSSSAIVRMLAGLAIVLAVIYAVYWLLKTYAKSKRGDTSDARLTVLGTTTLAPNKALHLVRVGAEVVLVGSADSGVTPIRVYDADALRKAGLDVDEPAAGNGNGRGRAAATQPAGALDALRRWTAR